MAAHLEPDAPGMHTTDTIDFEYVISGEVWHELDDGQEIQLKRDCNSHRYARHYD